MAWAYLFTGVAIIALSFGLPDNAQLAMLSLVQFSAGVAVLGGVWRFRPAHRVGWLLLGTGCLFLGAAESLTRLGVELDLAEVGGAFAYVRPGNRPYFERPPSNVPIAPTARRLQDGSWPG